MENFRRKRIGKVQQKTLSLLLAGIALGFSRSPKTHLKIFREIPKEFGKIDALSLEYGIHRLYEDKFIYLKETNGGIYTPHLTKEGRKIARIFAVDDIKIEKPKKWDRKWRIVSFDIPENKKGLREEFRRQLKRLGFIELHKSVFCYPYDCGTEIMEIATFYNLLPHIVYLLATEISKEPALLAHFDIHN